MFKLMRCQAAWSFLSLLPSLTLDAWNSIFTSFSFNCDWFGCTYQQSVSLHFYWSGCISMSSLPNVLDICTYTTPNIHTKKTHDDRCICVGVSAQNTHSFSAFAKRFVRQKQRTIIVVCIHLLSLYFSIPFYSLTAKNEKRSRRKK